MSGLPAEDVATFREMTEVAKAAGGLIAGVQRDRLGLDVTQLAVRFAGEYRSLVTRLSLEPELAVQVAAMVLLREADRQ